MRGRWLRPGPGCLTLRHSRACANGADIVHVDRLPSIIKDGALLCDAEIMRRGAHGTTIGLNSIKQRRLKELTFNSHPNLHAGDCVPFYFCPRSVMLYVVHMGNNPELEYRDGQGPILHLEADLRRTVRWANDNHRRWVFTSSNAGSYYFEDYSDLSQLNMLDWEAIQAAEWSGSRKGPKQAEFLVECSFPWNLISCIGVHSRGIRDRVLRMVQASSHRPTVEIKPDWYY